MKGGTVLKLLIWIFLLGQYQISAARPVAGIVREDHRQEMKGKQQVRGQDWPVTQSQPLSTEDYSLPRRRRPVHNKYDP